MAIDGTWDVTMKTGMGPQKSTIILTTEGSALTGSMTSPMGTVTIDTGTADGNSATWTAKVTAPMAMTMECTATVDGDSISGEAKLGSFGTAPFTGNRA
jgi:hypothetical protein